MTWTASPDILRNAARDEIRLIVVTDNERILGLGDQGAGGMPIPVGKLALYSAAAGIHPGLTLPVSLDVGTDREELLADPLYVGWRHPRLRGAAYDEVVEAFVAGVREVHPRAVLQWEDFKQHNAIRLLARYREWVCTFNDDIQGTAAIAVATILASLRASGRTLADARFVLAGAGAAGTGIARLLHLAMVEDGMGAEEARHAIAVLDSHGLVVEGRPGLDEDKVDAALPRDFVAALGLDPDGPHDLREVIVAFRPNILLGTTGIGGAFDEGVIRAVAAACEHPIVLPLSNPTANTEARPADIMAWTDGRAIVATGSPFPPVEVNGVARRVPQANNSYVFPGMGLGAIVSEARILPESAFLVAARRLASMATPEMLAGASCSRRSATCGRRPRDRDRRGGAPGPAGRWPPVPARRDPGRGVRRDVAAVLRPVRGGLAFRSAARLTSPADRVIQRVTARSARRPSPVSRRPRAAPNGAAQRVIRPRVRW